MRSIRSTTIVHPVCVYNACVRENDHQNSAALITNRPSCEKNEPHFLIYGKLSKYLFLSIEHHMVGTHKTESKTTYYGCVSVFNFCL